MITRSKLEKWQQADSQLKHWKKEEAELRREICGELLEGMPIGTHNFEKVGHEIKAVQKVNTSIDEDLLSYVWDDFTEEERECFKFKPSLVSKAYKELDDKENVNQVLVNKPGMPTLSIKPIID